MDSTNHAPYQPGRYFPRFVGLAIAMTTVLMLTGCGEKGPVRYRLSGKITYGENPIPAGSVTLIPDSSQGNSGPSGSAKIVDGQYDTEEDGIGHVGGPHIIKIVGLDAGGGEEDDEFAESFPMFPSYEIKLDLSQEDQIEDLEVPADWVTPKQRRPIDPGP